MNAGAGKGGGPEGATVGCSPVIAPEKFALAFVSEKKPLIPVMTSVPAVAVGAMVSVPEAVMPLPLTEKAYESARAVWVAARVPAKASSAGRITFERDRVGAVPGADEEVPWQNAVFMLPSELEVARGPVV